MVWETQRRPQFIRRLGGGPCQISKRNRLFSTSIILNSEASPKAISERTSYLQVRLEFLRYPHLIPALFNVRGFGPPVRFTAPSTWTWVDHMVSGLRQHTHSPYSDSLSLRLRLFNLTSHAIVTRRFILQKARYHPLTGSNLL